MVLFLSVQAGRLSRRISTVLDCCPTQTLAAVSANQRAGFAYGSAPDFDCEADTPGLSLSFGFSRIRSTRNGEGDAGKDIR